MRKVTRSGVTLLEGLFALAILALLLVPVTTTLVGENEESAETVRFMQLLDDLSRQEARDPSRELWSANYGDGGRELVLRRPGGGTDAASPPEGGAP